MGFDFSVDMDVDLGVDVGVGVVVETDILSVADCRSDRISSGTVVGSKSSSESLPSDFPFPFTTRDGSVEM